MIINVKKLSSFIVLTLSFCVFVHGQRVRKEYVRIGAKKIEKKDSDYVVPATPSPVAITFMCHRRVRPAELVNNLPVINDLRFNQNVLTKKCSAANNSCSENVLLVDVFTDVRDEENDVLVYDYTVSGGKIIGKGVSVIWDLSDTEVGVYTITVGVDDGGEIVKKSKEIEVTKCTVCK